MLTAGVAMPAMIPRRTIAGTMLRKLEAVRVYPNRVLTRGQLNNLTQGRQADLLDRSIDLLGEPYQQ